MPDALSRRSRTTPTSRPTSTPTPMPSGCWRTSSSATVWSAPVGTAAAGTIEDQAGATRAVRPAGRRQRTPLGPAAAGLPRHVHRRDHPLAPLHRPADAAGTDRQADPGRRHRQQRRRHHRRVVVEVAAEQGDAVDPVERVDRAEVPCGTAGRQVLSRPRRTCRCRGSARPRRCSRPLFGVGPDDLRAAAAPTTSSSRRIRRSRWSCRCGWAPATSPRSRTWRASTATPCTSRTAPATCSTSIVYATGYNITFPFFDPDFISAPDNQIRLYKRMFKPGIDDSGVHRFRPGGADAVPVRGVPGAAAGRLRGGPLRAAVGRRDGAGDRRRPAAATPGHCTDRPRHTQQVDYFYYEHDMRTKELPAGAKRAAAAATGTAGGAGMRSRTDRRPPQRSDHRRERHPRRARHLAAGERASTTSTSPTSPSRRA